VTTGADAFERVPGSNGGVNGVDSDDGGDNGGGGGGTNGSVTHGSAGNNGDDGDDGAANDGNSTLDDDAFAAPTTASPGTCRREICRQVHLDFASASHISVLAVQLILCQSLIFASLKLRRYPFFFIVWRLCKFISAHV
jgi:hypothetical protein